MRHLSISRWILRAAALGAAIALALPMTASTVAAGGAPVMVKDIRMGGSSAPADLVDVGGTLYFTAIDGIHGRELWKSDGTKAGTRMVKDIRPGLKGSKPYRLVGVGSTLFFAANDGIHGRELWKSDGTRAGTALVKDLMPDSEFGSSTSIGRATAVGGRLFFVASFPNPGVANASLYVTDGTAGGTKVVPVPGAESIGIGPAMGGKLFFAVEDYLGVSSLWKSDGTAAGTKRVTHAALGFIDGLSRAGNLVYFFTRSPGGANPIQLWRTDGSAAGTLVLTDKGDLKGYDPEWDAPPVALGGKIYFVGSKLWKSNGTTPSTKAIGGFTNADLSGLTTTGGRLYFVERGSASVPWHLWLSSGTTDGTIDLGPVADSDLEVASLTNVGGTLCFGVFDIWNGTETWSLWESDGTVDGAHAVTPFVKPPEEGIVPRASVGGTLFFAADDGAHGTELWSYTP